MPRIDNKKFYISAIDMYGISAKGVNWLSKESQHIRFKTILNMLPENLDNFSIADAGCGFGDFYIYMQERGLFPKQYTGIDILKEMYSIASSRTGCRIIVADICKDTIPKADFYICSGAMNTLESFETYLFIKNCYESSRYGFVFNILHGIKQSKTYNYFTTEQIKKMASHLGVKKLKMNNSYMDNDITVGFFK